ncbi:MAG: PAS domain S-box protein [Bacteroidia bacterium]|nr:PAS domain S-box protein [Bacteroidia bacterium]
MDNANKQLDALKRLNKLQLAIGTSLDFKENAKTFLDEFCNQEDLHFVAFLRRSGEQWAVEIKVPGEVGQVYETSDLIDAVKSSAESQITQIETDQLEGWKISVFRFKDYALVYGCSEQGESTLMNPDHLEPVLVRFVESCKTSMVLSELQAETENRRKSEELIHEREELFRFGANSLSEGIFATDPNGRITYINRAMTPITGYRYDELFQSNVKDVFVPVDRNKSVVDLVTGSGYELGKVYEFELVHKSGKSYWARVSAAEFKGSSGESIGTIATMLDITERILVNKELEQNRKELEDLVTNMYDAFVIFSEDGFLKKINTAGEKILRYDQKHINKLHISDLVHPDDLPKANRFLEKLKTDGYFSGYEGRIISQNGKVKYVEVNSTAIMENGKLIGSREIWRDITRRKEIERVRKKSEDQLQLIIDTALDAVISADIEGNVTHWSKNAERIFGYSPEEAIGSKLTELIIPQNYVAAHEKGWAHYRKTGEGPVLDKRIEITGVDKAGNEFPIELSISAVEEGEHTFFSAFVRDITERKTIEAQKESLLNELGDANQELRDFAYIVSHDLKAPLRSIGSLSDWLSQDYSEVLDDQGKELLGLLKGRISRMHNLIEGVLQYSKIGRLSNETEEVDVKLLVQDLIQIFQDDDYSEIHLDMPSIQVQFDRIRLQQVFQNLIGNAIKFTDKTKGVITVAGTETDDAYIFSVRDNGPGISEKHFDKIFQIFQTLQSKDEYESTGIGLSIVKRIVERNGGTIWVESELGTGSVFSFTVPKKD